MCRSQGLVLPEAPERGSSITQAVLGSAAHDLPSVLLVPRRGFPSVPVQREVTGCFRLFQDLTKAAVSWLVSPPHPSLPPKLGHLNLTCYQQMRLECFHCGKESHSESVLSPAQAPSLHIPFLDPGVSFLLFPSCTWVCVTATALVPQQTEQVFALVLFGEALMLLCRLDQRAVELLKDQKNVKRSKLCLGHSQWDGSLQWGQAGGAGAQSSKVPVRPCGFKGSAVELC